MKPIDPQKFMDGMKELKSKTSKHFPFNLHQATPFERSLWELGYERCLIDVLKLFADLSSTKSDVPK